MGRARQVIQVVAGWAVVATATAQANDLKAFPAPDPGMQRVVIRVPAVPVPDDHRVEVMIGRTLEVDCNRHMLSAKVARKVAQGWGYSYYVVSDLKGPASTMMACPPDQLKRREFVRANVTELSWLRYNPRLPIVVYVPEGVEVRYRIWRVAGSAEPGRVE